MKFLILLMIENKKLRLGMTRAEVKAILGEPSDFGGTSRKHKIPCVLKYGVIEFGFGPYEDSGIVYIMDSEIHEMLESSNESKMD